MTSTDALFLLGVLVAFLALWLIWPAVAILAVGAVIVSTAVGLALLKRREGEKS